MTHETITEGNKLIAEFMGFIPRTDLHTKGALFMQRPITGDATHSPCYIVDKKEDPEDEFNELQYHKDFSWIMSAVDKIASMGLHFNIQINIRSCESWIDWLGCENEHLDLFRKFYNAKFMPHDEKDKIESVYKTVLQFVNFYNEYKNNNA